MIKNPQTSLLVILVLVLGATPLPASESKGSAGLYVRLLKSGKLPKQRLGPVIRLVCSRGSADDLSYVFAQALSHDGYTGQLRLHALNELAHAAQSRKIKPTGDLSSLGSLLHFAESDEDQEIQLATIRLAGWWGVTPLVGSLSNIATSPDHTPRERQAALTALSRIDVPESNQAIRQLISGARAQPVRYQGVAALARLDVEAAAPIAASVFTQGTEEDDPGPAVAAFLDRRHGSNRLAEALRKEPPPADVARLALRYMYSVGRTDAELIRVLGESAHIAAAVKPLSPDELQQLIADVWQQGDPSRGEMVMRRVDVSCFKCHSLGGVGGKVGPDLIELGGSSPIEYLVESILFPEKAIKEQYRMLTVLTADTEVLQGIIVEQNDDRVVLKTATGETRTIAVDDIEDQHEGGSLMPQGLANFLTRRELVDLVRFLSELGKPDGPYHTPATHTVRRWRLMVAPAEDPANGMWNPAMFRTHILEADAQQWNTLYGTFLGQLPLKEVRRVAADSVVYLQADVDVARAGAVKFRVEVPDGSQVWWDDQQLEDAPAYQVTPPRGRHQLTLRIVPHTLEDESSLSVRLETPADSSAQVTPVGGD